MNSSVHGTYFKMREHSLLNANYYKVISGKIVQKTSKRRFFFQIIWRYVIFSYHRKISPHLLYDIGSLHYYYALTHLVWILLCIGEVYIVSSSLLIKKAGRQVMLCCCIMNEDRKALRIEKTHIFHLDGGPILPSCKVILSS